MHDLIEETNKLLKENLFPSIITIALFVVHFLAIHPFQDGNGRLSRILTNLLLIKYGYDYIQYYSLEKIIEETKKEYYSALRNTQKTFSSEEVDYSPWLTYFTSILKRQTVRLDIKIKEYKESNTLSKNEQSVLDAIKELNGVSYSEIKAEFPNLKDNALRLIIKKLFQKELIVKHGQGKGMWYSIRKN